MTSVVDAAPSVRVTAGDEYVATLRAGAVATHFRVSDSYTEELRAVVAATQRLLLHWD